MNDTALNFSRMAFGNVRVCIAIFDSECTAVSFGTLDVGIYSRLALGLEVFAGFTEKKADIPISTISATVRMRILYFMFHFLIICVPFFQNGISGCIQLVHLSDYIMRPVKSSGPWSSFWCMTDF